MALQLTKTTPYGVDASYHRITGISWDCGAVNIEVSSYPDKDTREDNASPIFVSSYATVVTQNHFTRPELYDYLKSQPDFEWATDV